MIFLSDYLVIFDVIGPGALDVVSPGWSVTCAHPRTHWYLQHVGECRRTVCHCTCCFSTFLQLWNVAKTSQLRPLHTPQTSGETLCVCVCTV